MEKTPEQGYIGPPNAQRGLRGVSDGTDTQVRAWIPTSGRPRLIMGDYIIEEIEHEKVIGKIRKETL